MSHPIQLTQNATRSEIQQLLQRFLTLHQGRLQLILDDLTESQRDLLGLIPLLLHINHPMLPGYVSAETPSGVYGFDVDRDLARIARGRFHGFSYQKRATPRYDIRGLYVMGSGGTLAYSHHSDLDFWVCYDPALGAAALDQFNAKLQKLEAYAADYGLEIHFFSMNLDRFRAGETQALSKESSGSTQHILLLEEFYRTAVYLAGAYPLWWLVPVAVEESGDYASLTEHLMKRHLIHPQDFLDFGNLSHLPPDEFFGTAHWQLYKGINDPYKAVLKILLVEAYSQEFPAIRWLCNEIKEAVHRGTQEVEILDSYQLMYRRVAKYLESRDETNRLELARRCFYFKVGHPLSRPIKRQQRWQSKQLLRLVTDWGWDMAVLSQLDQHHQWKTREVMEERDKLVGELQRSYRMLVDFASQYAKSAKIDEVELNLLGRKLYAALDRRPGKIDSINPNISSDLSESLLTLKRVDNGWQLFVGEVNAVHQDKKPLKQAQRLLELMAWAHLNGVLTKESRLISVQNRLGSATLPSLRQVLGKQFPDKSVFKAPILALGYQPRLNRCSLFVNVELDLGHLTRGSGNRLVSDHYDPLSYSARHICLVQAIDQLIATSWGEVLCHQYQGSNGLLECLAKFLQMTVAVAPGQRPPRVDVFCPDEHYGQAIARRVTDLINFIGHIFGPDGPGPESRYILPLGNRFYIIQAKEKRYGWQDLATYDEVLDALADPKPDFSQIVPDPQVFPDSPLLAICAKCEPGQLQQYFHVHDGCIDTYLVDEQGSLFFQSFQETDLRYLLAHQHRFLSSLQQLRNLAMAPSRSGELSSPPHYYQLTSLKQQWRARLVSPPAQSFDAKFIPLRLIHSDGLHDTLANKEVPLVLACGEREFSTSEYGDGIYQAIARHLLELRQGRKNYPIYLTAIEPNSVFSTGLLPTMSLLRHKRHVEQRLNQALKALS